MQKIVNQDPGFITSNLMMMSISPSIQGYSELQAQRIYEELLARIERIPGIQSASLAGTVAPEDWSSRVSIFYEGQVPALDYYRGHEFEVGIRVDMNNVAPKYFRTMGIPILKGRSEEHTSELQSRLHLVCRLLLEKKKKKNNIIVNY